MAHNYQLNDKELEELDKFLAKLPKKLKNKPVKIIFDRGSGIGIGVTVEVEGRQKNITDYSVW